jgi:hypothetical protein
LDGTGCRLPRTQTVGTFCHKRNSPDRNMPTPRHRTKFVHNRHPRDIHLRNTHVVYSPIG